MRWVVVVVARVTYRAGELSRGCSARQVAAFCADADLLIIAGPRRALAAGEVDVIDIYSTDGKLERLDLAILADDLGWNDLTFQGGGVAGGSVPTPHIDSLARDGVSFANGYAANGTCAPSRAVAHRYSVA